MFAPGEEEAEEEEGGVGEVDDGDDVEGEAVVGEGPEELGAVGGEGVEEGVAEGGEEGGEEDGLPCGTEAFEREEGKSGEGSEERDEEERVHETAVKCVVGDGVAGADEDVEIGEGGGEGAEEEGSARADGGSAAFAG